VVGGGMAGMHAAIKLSELNLKVTLIEKDEKLGGKLSEFSRFYGLDMSPDEILASKLKAISESKNIEVLCTAKLTRLEGEIGNFSVKIAQNGREVRQKFGAVIIATGYTTRFINQIYDLEPRDNILTQSRLSKMLKLSEVKKLPVSVAFILDILDEHSRIQTILALTNAMILKERFGSEVYIFYKNLKVDGTGLEKLYSDCRRKGVIFFRFRDKIPDIYRENGKIKVKVEDILLGGEEVTAVCDLLVMDEKQVPDNGFERLRALLNVAHGPGNFYQEDNIHLYPVDSARTGIFFAGNCHADLDLNRVLIDAEAAALSAYNLLSQGKITTEIEKVVVAPEKCRVCLTCVRACPHDAIRIVEAEPCREAARIFDLACQGCGICAAICPAKAITYKGCVDEQIISELEVIGGRA
jgi:heterodisulfide reductase subunit A-like polyferredoxin